MRWLLLFGYLLLMLVTASVCQHWLNQQLLEKASQQSANLAAFLRYSIGRYASLPGQLAASPLLQQTPAALNPLLRQLQQSAQVADLYLMDPDGRVLAASNDQSAQSYVGRDFAFRPYFQQARAGAAGFYYALGHTSGMRGVYYSAPVYQQQQLLGVLAVKVDVESLEAQQQAIAGLAGSHFLVTGQQQDVFLSDVATWRFTTLNPQPPNDSTRQRYLTQPLTPLQFVQQAAYLTPWQPLWQMPLAGKTQPMLAVSQHLPEFGWQLTVLTPLRDSRQLLLTALLVVSLLFVSVLLAFRLRRERLQRQRQLQRHNQQLEQRVLARTADLADSNQRLQQQMHEHQQTEHALRQTEQELVQAARLATIGSLSASLNHELNQPLTALSGYCQTTVKMLSLAAQDPSLLDSASANLNRMQQQINRLANIVAQFKDFSRKSSGKSEAVALPALLQAALALVQHQLGRTTVTLQLPEYCPPVAADTVQLEQVLVNLLTNALQAMQAVAAPPDTAPPDTAEPAATPQLHLTLHSLDGHVCVVIRDNGPGVEPHHLEKIFEAFFTTKGREGLGLGLSISQRIVQSFGGQLSVRNHPDGGAEFSLQLPIMAQPNPM